MHTVLQPCPAQPAQRAAGATTLPALRLSCLGGGTLDLARAPGVPMVVPGELLDAETLDYLTAGVRAGMHVPDAADATLRTIRVVARAAESRL